MEQSEVYIYLTNKYKELNLLDSSENIIESSTGFDFNIYPDTGYIPQCKICNSMYTTFIDTININSSNNIIDSKHISCNCLWFEYYRTKILGINSKITFNKK